MYIKGYIKKDKTKTDIFKTHTFCRLDGIELKPIYSKYMEKVSKSKHLNLGTFFIKRSILPNNCFEGFSATF